MFRKLVVQRTQGEELQRDKITKPPCSPEGAGEEGKRGKEITRNVSQGPRGSAAVSPAVRAFPKQRFAALGLKPQKRGCWALR